MATPPKRPSLSGPANEPTMIRQLREWGVAVTDAINAANIGLRGRQFGNGTLGSPAPVIWPPHAAIPYDDLVVQVGPSRDLGVAAPDEMVFVSYRGAIISIAKTTVENVTISGSGYIVYEVTCTAGTWAADAEFSTTLTALADSGKVYIPIAKVTVDTGVISAIQQLLRDNPTVHIGSPRHSIIVDPDSGRLQLEEDALAPGPYMVYATDSTGQRKWVPYSDICAYCDGVPPEDNPPCGECSALPTCLSLGAWVPDTCGTACVATTAPEWDGKLTLNAAQCRYEATATVDGCTMTFFYTRYYDSEAETPYCYWTLTVTQLEAAGSGPNTLVWQGTTADGDEQGTITRTDGCDATASLTPTLCLRTIEVTISGLNICTCMACRYDVTSAAYNDTYTLTETGPGTGIWTLDSDIVPLILHPIDYNVYPDTFGDNRNCGETPTADDDNRVLLTVTYDEVSTWTVTLTSKTPPFSADIDLFNGTDTGGDETGGTVSNSLACDEGGGNPCLDVNEMGGGSATITVL